MSRILEIDIDYTTFQHPCVDMYTYQEGMVRYRCKFGNGLVIADRTVGDFITLEDCCKQGGYRDDEDADSDINPDMTGPDTNTPRNVTGDKNQQNCQQHYRIIEKITLRNVTKVIMLKKYNRNL